LSDSRGSETTPEQAGAEELIEEGALSERRTRSVDA
jgi:hypothetical protein